MHEFTMDRTDSAFDETFRPRSSSRSAKPNHHHVRRNNSTPKKERRPNPQSLQTFPETQATHHQPLTTPRSSLHATRRQKSTASTASSSEHSNTKSRKRSNNHGGSSHPSSRRTSCTIIDPSRPARHYRIASAQTCPTQNRDIDDVLALHFRACSLFQNPSYQQSSSLPNSPPRSSSGAAHGVAFPLPRRANTDFAAATKSRPDTAPPHLVLRPNTTNTISSSSRELPHSPVSPTSLPDHAALLPDPNSTVPTAPTTTHWLSPSTRRTQYEAIDRETTGMRGLVRRILPRCVSGGAAAGHQPFYEKDRGDVASVRRYRMDVGAEEGDGDDEDEVEREKNGRAATGAGAGVAEARGRKWSCF